MQVSNELADKWASHPADQHIPLTQHMVALSMKAVALATLGSGMKDDKELLQISKAYHVVSTCTSCTAGNKYSQCINYIKSELYILNAIY